MQPAAFIPTVNQGSTAAFTFSFFDETGNPTIPTSVKWSLYDGFGNVVNSRSQVTVTPAATVTIYVKGADTDFETLVGGQVDAGARFILINAQYTGPGGAGLPLNGEFQFNITALVGQT
jgi:hypothetical protein